MTSIIDVTLSRGLALPVQDWKVDRTYNGSDHNTIAFKLGGPAQQEVDGVRMWDGVDWPKFKDKLNTSKVFIPRVINEKKLDKMLASLYSAVDLALDETAPKICPRKKGKDFAWYTE